MLAMTPAGIPYARGFTSNPGRRSRAAAVIPARIGSTRFPRKVLARDTGKYLIQHVWEGILGTPGLDRAIIATDSEEVMAAARSFGADVRLTSPDHVSGTDRVAEVARGLDEEIIINVQGDEPLIRKEDVARVIGLLVDGGEGDVMSTLAFERRDAEGFHDPNNVKVVTDLRGRAIYFSRAPIPGGIPQPAGTGPASEPPARAWLHHIGIYGFRRNFLLDFSRLPPGRLEKLERLEQLRALENGYGILVGITTHRYRGIDTPAEYREFVKAMFSPLDPPEGT
jgi:3-deoxy-manno-octulosonate cytidylyltransferase (CMP-KDO synthetase)